MVQNQGGRTKNYSYIWKEPASFTMAKATRPSFPTPTYEEFCQFLKENSAYTNFRKNYKEFTGKTFSKDVYIKDVNNEFPINTFDWKKSPQGRDYWSSLDNKWFETWFKPFYDAVSDKNQKKRKE